MVPFGVDNINDFIGIDYRLQGYIGPTFELRKRNTFFMALEITEANFEEIVMKSDKPVLVDFWAPWCGPCKMIAPILNEIADEYAGKMRICKVDVDSNPETAAKFNVRGIPTLLVFKNGAVEATKVGALSKVQLTEFVNGLV